MSTNWKRGVKFALAMAAALLVVLFASRRIGDHHPETGDVNLDEPLAQEAAQRGADLVQIHCAGCHGPDLCGKMIEQEDEGIWLGPNVSSAGRCSSYTEEDFCRVVREFRRNDGTPIAGPMPAVVTRDLSDDDLRAIWTYSRADSK